MTVLVVFNLVMALLCIAAMARRIPRRLTAAILNLIHGTVGITAPSDQQIRAAVIVWIVSAIVIVDGMAYLMAYVF